MEFILRRNSSFEASFETHQGAIANSLYNINHPPVEKNIYKKGGQPLFV